MTVHCLKSWPEYFKAVRDGTKTCEIRRNDRPFKLGEHIVLEEFRPGVGTYTGEKERLEITRLAARLPEERPNPETDGLVQGYVLISFKRLGPVT